MKTKTAVGIDLSWTHTGLVALTQESESYVWPPDIRSTVAKTVKSDAKDFDNPYHRMSIVVDQVMNFVHIARPDFIVTEGYSFGSKNAREKMGELGGHFRHRLWDAGYPFYIVPPTSLKKFVTGAGNASKTKVALECFKRWEFESDDDNLTDAYGLARIGVDILAGKDTKAFKAFMKKLELIGDRVA